ncbi:MAG: hypothetical protein KAR38_10255, partial [Calditrichia bacterium]|nr:hypothetical protein [Calditrichia bacterium]
LNNYIKNFENLNVDIFNIGLCGIIKSDNFNIEDILVPKYIQNEFSDIKYINNIINFNFKKCHFLITTKNPILNLDEFVNNPKIISSDIVDMEAYYIADYCHKYTYKFNTIKITSDYCSNNPEKIIKTNLKNLQIKISEVINFLINDYFKNNM